MKNRVGTIKGACKYVGWWWPTLGENFDRNDRLEITFHEFIKTSNYFLSRGHKPICTQAQPHKYLCYSTLKPKVNGRSPSLLLEEKKYQDSNFVSMDDFF